LPGEQLVPERHPVLRHHDADRDEPLVVATVLGLPELGEPPLGRALHVGVGGVDQHKVHIRGEEASRPTPELSSSVSFTFDEKVERPVEMVEVRFSNAGQYTVGNQRVKCRAPRRGT
jgi:hypothetical protein